MVQGKVKKNTEQQSRHSKMGVVAWLVGEVNPALSHRRPILHIQCETKSL